MQNLYCVFFIQLFFFVFRLDEIFLKFQCELSFGNFQKRSAKNSLTCASIAGDNNSSDIIFEISDDEDSNETPNTRTQRGEVACIKSYCSQDSVGETLNTKLKEEVDDDIPIVYTSADQNSY